MKYIKQNLACLMTYAFTCILLDSCATTQADKLTQIRLLSYTAASIGTLEALKAKPEYRPAFEIAYANLNDLVELKTINGPLLHNIILSLPVKELKSDSARIAIEGVTVLYDALTQNKVSLEAQPYVLAAATGIRDGMKVGLGK